VETRAAFAREATARRRLHNAVQELRGNIRVFVRVRPDGGAAGGVLHAEDGHRVLATTAGATKARRQRAGLPATALGCMQRGRAAARRVLLTAGPAPAACAGVAEVCARLAPGIDISAHAHCGRGHAPRMVETHVRKPHDAAPCPTPACANAQVSRMIS
jgi:hypothetical protein